MHKPFHLNTTHLDHKLQHKKPPPTLPHHHLHLPLPKLSTFRTFEHRPVPPRPPRRTLTPRRRQRAPPKSPRPAAAAAAVAVAAPHAEPSVAPETTSTRARLGAAEGDSTPKVSNLQVSVPHTPTTVQQEEKHANVQAQAGKAEWYFVDSSGKEDRCAHRGTCAHRQHKAVEEWHGQVGSAQRDQASVRVG